MKPGLDYIGIATPFYCNDGNGLFLFQKRQGNEWDPGSGKLDFESTPEENVLREVKEEYGCQGEIQEQLPAHLASYIHGNKKRHWLSIPFFVKVNPKEVRNNEPEEIDEIGWFSLDKLPEPLHPGFNFTLTNYRKYFEKYNKSPAS